jgi:coenzyme F420-reducing hydrogenase beta subunit
MIKIDDIAQCCGCSACYSVCPKDAIRMEADGMGFLYPQVEMDKCVDCGFCEKVCAFDDSYDKSLNLPEPQAFAARHKDYDEVLKSTSGAVFVAASDYILSRGGVVYGAGFEGYYKVVHKRATNQSERDELRKSKYVQSDVNGVFRLVRKDVEAGLEVLFTGTPCQTAGLASYLGERLRSKVILMDIVCHGVPSPKVWEEYLKWQEEKNGCKAADVEFRDKRFGWRSHRESFDFAGRYVHSASYTYLFYKHYMLRESCGSCPYTNLQRPSDLTIADLWSKAKLCPDFASDNKGCSLLLCNTEKGRELLENQLSKDLNLAPVDINPYLQPNMKSSSVLSPLRHKFAEDFQGRGVEYVMKKYGDMGWRYKIVSLSLKIYQTIRQTARKILGRA